MIPLPPPIRRDDFFALDDIRTDVQQYFAPIVDQLQEFLNASPPITGIQEVRKKPWKAFVLPARIEHKHWWFSHHGGRSEAQWNLGMFPTHLRFGIGFNRTGAAYADIPAVERHLACFLDELRKLARENGSLGSMNLWSETHRQPNGELFTQTADELLQPGRTDGEDWVFVGRLLASGSSVGETNDLEILEDPRALADELTRTAQLLWEPWKQTMLCARRQR